MSDTYVPFSKIKQILTFHYIALALFIKKQNVADMDNLSSATLLPSPHLTPSILGY